MITFLDNIASEVAIKIAQILVRAKVRPIAVTIFRFVVCAPISLYFFSRGDYLSNVIGLFLYMALALLDWADGEMAQMYKLPKKTAPFGRLIDHTSDRVLMMIVLGSIFYAGMMGPNKQIWTILTILYYSSFFFMNVFLYEFEKVMHLNFTQYPEIEKQMYQINKSPGFFDRFLYSVLYVHKNSLTRIFFTHNFLLIIGILSNQILLIFIVITSMIFLRSASSFYIEYKTLKVEETNSALVKAMRIVKLNRE